MADFDEITFTSSGTRCAGWLARPAGEGPHPLIVMGHGFSAVADQRLQAYAERFVDAGIGALIFDYRSFGRSDGRPRQVLDIPGQRADFHAAIAHARSLEWVDARRVALFGTSFAGGHVIAVAAEDPTVAATISQCPFQDGLATSRALLGPGLVKLAAHGIADQVGALLGRDPHYVPAVAPPGQLGVLTVPDAQPGFAAITPEDSTWENRVAARVALTFGLYRPGLKASQVRCPSLYIVCDEDSLVPAASTVKCAARNPRSEVVRLQTGHFDVYVGDWFEQSVGAMTDFLVRVLEPATTPVPG